jgi:MYXO-CTERM domain-containing protein
VLRKLLGALFLLSIAAHADPLSIALDQSVLNSPQGGYYNPGCTNSDGSLACVVFTGTITTDGLQNYYLQALYITMNSSNPDAGADVFDNTYGSASGGNNYFLSNTPYDLGPGNYSSDPDTYTGGLFEVDVNPNAPLGDYMGTATVDYTDDLDCTDSANPCTSAVNFQVVVTAPEPAAYVLALTGLAAVAVIRRRTFSGPLRS